MAKAFEYPPRAPATAAAQWRAASQSTPACRTRRANIRDTPPAAAETKDTATPHSASHKTSCVTATAAISDRPCAAAKAAPVPPPRGTAPQRAPSNLIGEEQAAPPRAIPPSPSPHPALHRYPESAARIRHRPTASPRPRRRPHEFAPPPPSPREYVFGSRTESARTPASRPAHRARVPPRWFDRREPDRSPAPGLLEIPA